MSPHPLPSRIALASCFSLLGLAGAWLPLSQPALSEPALAQLQPQACPCSCAQPSLGLIGADGLCQCPCASVPIPGISEETLAGPPKPPKAGGPTPSWTIEPGFDDGFGDPFWGGW